MLYILPICYLGRILEEGRKKQIQIFTFLFIFQPPEANWVKDIFSWRLFSVKRRILATLGSGICRKRDVWKWKIPVISSGQAPVSHQGSGHHKWSWQKVSPSCPISQANTWEPNGPRKYLFPKSVNDRLQRSWWSFNLVGCFSGLSRKHRHEEPEEMKPSEDELCSPGRKRTNKWTNKNPNKQKKSHSQNPNKAQMWRTSSGY